MSRSGRSATRIGRIPKLIVRVRFPSPAPHAEFPAQVAYRPGSLDPFLTPLDARVPDWPPLWASHTYTAPPQRPLPIMEGALLLTDLPPVLPCACSAGSGSGRCGASDSEVPVAT